MSEKSTRATRPESETIETRRQAFAHRVAARFDARAHMALILLACVATGLLTTQYLLFLGVTSMLVRYPAMMIVAYGTFFFGVRVWLNYAGFATPSRQAHARLAEHADDILDIDLDIGGGSGGGSTGSVFRGGSGDFGGGGASASFHGSGRASQGGVGKLFNFGGGKSGGGGGSGGDDALVLIALILLVVAIFGAAIYVVFAAPTILSDAAFAGVLSGGLGKASQRIRDEDWSGSVWRTTRWPFALVMVLALVFAGLASYHYPDAVTLGDVLRML